MFSGVLCLPMLILFRNLKKDFYVFDTYVSIHVIYKQPQKSVLRLFDIKSEVLQNSVKEFSFSKTAVHLQLY